jgi:actin-related protein
MRTNWKSNNFTKESTKTSKGSVMAFVQKSVEESMKKFVRDKKRKRDESHFNTENIAKSSGDDDFDIDGFNDIVLSSDDDKSDT